MKNILWLAVFSCACTAKVSTIEPVIEKPVREIQKRDTLGYDPALLTGDPWVIQHRVQSAHSSSVTSSVSGKGAERPLEQRRLGYRVQLFSTTDYHAALEFRDKAGAKITENIYLDYEQPYYKIRVGNYDDREEAEGAKQAVRDLGFRDAWVVRTRILKTTNTTNSERGEP